MMEIVPQELEMYNFPTRDIVTTDTFQNLIDVLLSLKVKNEENNFDETMML